MPSPEKVERNKGIAATYRSGKFVAREVGDIFGISATRVIQILKKLRVPMRAGRPRKAVTK